MHGLGNTDITEYYDTGELWRKVDLQAGQRNGMFYEYYKTGEIKTVGYFRQDKRDGPFTTYWPDGVLKNQTIYDMNKKIMSKNYDEFGQLLRYDDF